MEMTLRVKEACSIRQDSEEHWKLTAERLQGCVSLLLLKNQRLRMALREARAGRKKRESPTRCRRSIRHESSTGVFHRFVIRGDMRRNRSCHVNPRTRMPGGNFMRTELVSAALAREPNRYALMQAAAQGACMLHRSHTRIPDTINDALRFLAMPRKKGFARRAPR